MISWLKRSLKALKISLIVIIVLLIGCFIVIEVRGGIAKDFQWAIPNAQGAILKSHKTDELVSSLVSIMKSGLFLSLLFNFITCGPVIFLFISLGYREESGSLRYCIPRNLKEKVNEKRPGIKIESYDADKYTLIKIKIEKIRIARKFIPILICFFVLFIKDSINFHNELYLSEYPFWSAFIDFLIFCVSILFAFDLGKFIFLRIVFKHFSSGDNIHYSIDNYLLNS